MLSDPVTLLQVNAVRKSGRFAWVEFATLQAAQTAMSLDGESLGNGIMKVSTSKTPIHTAGWRAQVRSSSVMCQLHLLHGLMVQSNSTFVVS